MQADSGFDVRERGLHDYQRIIYIMDDDDVDDDVDDGDDDEDNGGDIQCIET